MGTVNIGGREDRALTKMKLLGGYVLCAKNRLSTQLSVVTTHVLLSSLEVLGGYLFYVLILTSCPISW